LKPVGEASKGKDMSDSQVELSVFLHKLWNNEMCAL